MMKLVTMIGLSQQRDNNDI